MTTAPKEPQSLEELYKSFQSSEGKSILSNKGLTISAGVGAALIAALLPFLEVWGQLTTLEQRMDKRYERLHAEDVVIMQQLELQREIINDLENKLIRLEVYKDLSQ